VEVATIGEVVSPPPLLEAMEVETADEVVIGGIVVKPIGDVRAVGVPGTATQ